MPTLNWIGKDAVVNHHLQVPYHLLKDVPDLSCGDPGSGNLIVQGDNLVALKALLPYYAGQVKCIYIDPPYNTGNENWIYNDNVNSLVIREWLGKVVGKEGETLDRHDRWLCMMYPRLALLRRFLREDGLIFVSIDDNEVALLKLLMDEIFGANCYKNTIAVRRGIKSVQAQFADLSALAVGHEYILLYSRNAKCRIPKLNLTHDAVQPGKWDTFWRGTDRPTMRYEIFDQKPTSGQWRWEESRAKKAVKNYIEYLENHSQTMSIDEWYLDTLSSTNLKLDFVRKNEEGSIQYYVPPRSGKLLSDNWMDILLSGSETSFETEKNTILLQRIISWITNDKDIILDSFAGSGTTGHAVINQNRIDGGSRRFVLVEMEPNVAKEITAERVRRVAEGYINTKGEKVEGLGGGFRYCELGEPLFDESGKIRSSVSFGELARHVYFTETGEPLPRERVPNNSFLGECRGVGIYLLYNGILKDKSANGGNVLTRKVLAGLTPFDGPKVIYCAGCLLGKDRLRTEHITVRQTPYEIKVS